MSLIDLMYYNINIDWCLISLKITFGSDKIKREHKTAFC